MDGRVATEHEPVAEQKPASPQAARRVSHRAETNTVHTSGEVTRARAGTGGVPDNDRISGLLRAAVVQRTSDRAAGSQRAVSGGAVGRAVIQRSKESEALLTKLATPRFRPGPTVDVQKALVDKLDVEYADEFTGGLINLGGILIEEIPEDDDQLIDEAQLVDLPTAGGFISAGSPRAAKIKQLGFDRLVIENTLRTMIAAKQIKYLRLAGLPNDQWKILVELHYYRERDMTATGFHKDTLGETLFVNLNYHMNKQVIGPEVVVNPPSSEEHDARTALTLPASFRADLEATRKALGDPDEYQTDLVDPYGYVAFVDEAVHHATPFYGHRNVTRADLKWYLQTQEPTEFAEASAAYAKYRSRWLGWSYSSYLTASSISKEDHATWLAWMEILDDENTAERFTRNDLAELMDDDAFDELLEAVGEHNENERTQGRPAGFHAASIPKSGKSKIRPKNRPPLKRRLSNADFRKTLPPEPAADEKRRFFRTWVRVVPASKAEDLHRRVDEAERREREAATTVK
jgi:hypothetical protein